MGAIGAGIQVDHSHPGIDQPGVLPGAYVLSIPAAAGEQPVITPSSSALQPVSQSFPRGLRDLERHGPTGLLLDDRRPLPNDAALSNIAQTEFYQITAPQLGVQCDVEHREISCRSNGLQVLTDRPDVLWLKWGLRTGHSTSVPGFAG